MRPELSLEQLLDHRAQKFNSNQKEDSFDLEVDENEYCCDRGSTQTLLKSIEDVIDRNSIFLKEMKKQMEEISNEIDNRFNPSAENLRISCAAKRQKL